MAITCDQARGAACRYTTATPAAIRAATAAITMGLLVAGGLHRTVLASANDACRCMRLDLVPMGCAAAPCMVTMPAGFWGVDSQCDVPASV